MLLVLLGLPRRAVLPWRAQACSDLTFLVDPCTGLYAVAHGFYLRERLGL